MRALILRFIAAVALSLGGVQAHAAPCGELPAATAEPSGIFVTGRWETCKPRIAPGCEFGAYQVTFWRHACTSTLGRDFDILVSFEWIEGQPLLPGQPDANRAYRGLPYTASVPNFNLIVSRSVVRLADGRTTTQLTEDETARYFHLVGVVDRSFGTNDSQLMPGRARYKFCPSSSTTDYCNGVSGSIRAQPLFLEPPFLFSDGFERLPQPLVPAMARSD